MKINISYKCISDAFQSWRTHNSFFLSFWMLLRSSTVNSKKSSFNFSLFCSTEIINVVMILHLGNGQTIRLWLTPCEVDCLTITRRGKGLLITNKVQDYCFGSTVSKSFCPQSLTNHVWYTTITNLNHPVKAQSHRSGWSLSRLVRTRRENFTHFCKLVTVRHFV